MKIGKLSESVLKRSVLKEIKSTTENVLSGAAVGNDCALFSITDDLCLATSVQEGPICVDVSERADGFLITHLIQKAINNLVTKGAAPSAVAITFFFPEEVLEQDIKSYLRQANKFLSDQGIAYLGGQSCVSSRCTGTMASVTAYGKGNLQSGLKKPGPNMEIVVTKWVGLEGTALLAKANYEKLCERYPRFFVDAAKDFDTYLSIMSEAATAVKSDVCAMHDASKGGIFATLWELAEAAGVGLKVDMKKIPLRQETVEVCEELGVNPYKLLSGGSLVLLAAEGETLAEKLAEQGIPATVIGTVTEGNERILINDDEIRYLEKPDQDEIYRMFPNF